MAAQAAIAAEAAMLARSALSSTVDTANLAKTLPVLKIAVAALIRRYGSASATAALRFYRAERLAAGIAGRPTLQVAGPARLGQIGSAVDWATSPLWGASDLAKAEAQLQATVERLVLNQGRDTIISAVEQDKQAKGWARVPEAGACSFCALLATRGAVYKSEQSGGFEAHDHCRCHVEPVFNAYEPSAQIREWEATYRQVAVPGKPEQTRLRFRQALEGRLPH